MSSKEDLIKGINLCKEEKYNDAISVFNEILKENENDTDALYNRAKAYSRIKDFKNSIADFDKLVSLTNSPSMISERALAHFLNRNSEAAMKDLDLAASIDPENPYRYSSRAFIKDRLGDLEGAIADYNKAIELDPEDAISYNNRGLVEEKLGRKEASERSFKRADTIADGKPSSADNNSDKKQKPAIPEIKNEKTNSADQSKRKDNSTGVFSNFLKTTKSIISDKKERADFFEFIRSLGKK